MSEKITASVDANRILTISLSEGYTGEHNAQMLEIDIGPFADGYDYYILNFDNYSFKGKITSNVIRTSQDRPAYIDNGVIYCPLTSHLTCTGRLRIQLEAHKTLEEGGEIVRKSSVASLELKPSIMGEEDMMDSSSPPYVVIDELEKRICALEKRETGIIELPVAGEGVQGTVAYDITSEVQTDENGMLRLKYDKINSKSITILLIAQLLSENSSIRFFSAYNGIHASEKCLELSQFVLNGEIGKFLFAVWSDCNILYYDEAFNETVLQAKKDRLYCYRVVDDIAVIEEYGPTEMRKLIVEGV